MLSGVGIQAGRRIMRELHLRALHPNEAKQDTAIRTCESCICHRKWQIYMAIYILRILAMRSASTFFHSRSPSCRCK